MADTIKLRRLYTEAALAAAGMPRRMYLCRSCDHQWTGCCSRCLMCGRFTARQTGGVWSLDDPLTVPNANNLGIAPTQFEKLGLGGD